MIRLKIANLSHMQGVTEVTFHRWKRKFAGLQVSEAGRLKTLEEENRRLKRLVDEQALDNRVLQELLGKNVVTAED